MHLDSIFDDPHMVGKLIVFTMVGGEQTGDNSPKDFNECVSQEQLQATVDNAQKRMNEAIRKASLRHSLNSTLATAWRDWTNEFPC